MEKFLSVKWNAMILKLIRRVVSELFIPMLLFSVVIYFLIGYIRPDSHFKTRLIYAAVPIVLPFATIFIGVLIIFLAGIVDLIKGLSSTHR